MVIIGCNNFRLMMDWNVNPTKTTIKRHAELTRKKPSIHLSIGFDDVRYVHGYH